MATYSTIPAWEIPWTEEAGGLQSMGLLEIEYCKQLYANKLDNLEEIKKWKKYL